MAEVHPTARNDPHAERVRRYSALVRERGYVFDDDEPTPAEVEAERARRWFPRDAEDDD